MKKQAIRLVLLIFIVTLAPISSATESFIKIGVLNHLGKARSEITHNWEPTVDYLAMTLPEYDFEIVPLHSTEIITAITEKRVDFVLTNPSTFVFLSAQYGIKPLVTHNTMIDGESYSEYGSVIITQHDNNEIHHIADLRDKTIVAVEQSSFSGFQMVWRELKAKNINPFTDLFQLSFIHNHTQVVNAVTAEHYDAGILRTGTLEQLIHSKALDPRKIKIINPLKTANFPFMHSTPLYPKWTLSMLNDTDFRLAEKLTITLVRMPIFANSNTSWTLPKNHHTVEALLNELQLPPYERVDKQTVWSLVKYYWHWSLIAVLLLMVLSLSILMTTRRNKHLRLSKEKLASRYQLVVNSVADGLYGIDNQGRCTFINKAMQDMTGWQEQDVLNKKLHHIMHHTRKDGLPTPISSCPMYRSFQDQQAHFIEDDIFWCKQGHSISVEYSSTPLKNKEGLIIGGVVIFRDISARKAYQTKLHQHEQQLRHVARLNTLGEITSGIAHEINQPLTAIAMNARACVRMLENDQPNLEDCADIMEKVTSQAERAGEVIRHIRHFIKKDQLELNKVFVGTMIKTVNDLIQYDLNKHKITFILVIPKTPLWIHANEIQIQQVLINLIKNAIDSVSKLPEHERSITVSCQSKASQVQFKVCDTGAGVDKAILEQLFEPFNTNKYQGMGLGLSISQNIIVAHGGKIQLSSQPQHICFHFMLQRSKALT
ncbi:MAG: PhnD/SsuA/transferrin family substrate-binding protein [Thiotrichaceae bacterium]|nr:PhnD/SsuA/transferrin family substrate-binding protein [Thiotrichaceae bacterium]